MPSIAKPHPDWLVDDNSHLDSRLAGSTDSNASANRLSFPTLHLPRCLLKLGMEEGSGQDQAKAEINLALQPESG